MANKIQVRRGLKSKLPTLSSGEIGFTTDTRELFVGTGSGNVNMSGSQWLSGTAMSGTSTTTGAYYYAGCPLVKLGDKYLNTSNGNVYECTTAGSGTSARWTYKGCIKGATGAKGDKGDNGVDGTNAATKVVTTQAELNSAMSSLPARGGKIILREGSYELEQSYGYNITAGKTIVIEGMGSGATVLRYNGRISTNNSTVIFRNMTVNCANDADITDKASLVFENCVIGKLNGANSEIFNCTNLILSKCELNLDEEGNESYDCYSGIMSSGRVVLDKCTINCNSGTSYSSGLDLNLIYSCAEADISDCKISCSGQNRINLVYSGIPNINNCHIYMPSTRYSICHATTSTDVGGTFTGNYVEMYGSYMRFGAVNGNTFKQLAAGSSSANKIIMQCATNMMGNNFKGSAVYIDCQSKKCNISYNMADGGITVGSNASGGSAIGNLTY